MITEEEYRAMQLLALGFCMYRTELDVMGTSITYRRSFELAMMDCRLICPRCASEQAVLKDGTCPMCRQKYNW